jgi:quercetin dioxygenase-like cupin family protein
MSLERLKAIHDQLDGSMAVLSIMEQGKLTKSPQGEIICDGVSARVVFEGGGIQFLTSEYAPGSAYPKHSHDTSIEYLICYSGMFEVILFLVCGSLEIHLVRGSCVKIPAAVVHTVTSISGGKLAAVLVPPEKAY